jgi:hypothetical protein
MALNGQKWPMLSFGVLEVAKALRMINRGLTLLINV